VPVFSEDMPLADEPGAEPDDRSAAADDERGVPAGSAARPARYTAGERPASRPVSPSASAKRAQPSRKPRSQRGKP